VLRALNSELWAQSSAAVGRTALTSCITHGYDGWRFAADCYKGDL